MLCRHALARGNVPLHDNWRDTTHAGADRREDGVDSGLLFHLPECQQYVVSSFDYATRGLKYSRSSAQRRIKAARVVAQFRDVGELFEQGVLSLGTVGMLDGVITVSNAEELLDAIVGKSQEEVERVILRYHAPRACVQKDRPPKIRKIGHLES